MGADAREVVLDADELGGIWVGEWVEERGVDDAVDGGGGADAEGHGGDGDEREAGGAEE